MSKGYGRLLVYGGIGFVLFCVAGVILIVMLQSKEDGRLPFLMTSNALAWASWMGTAASIVGLAASVYAAIKAAKSADAAVDAKNSTIEVIHNLKDAHYGGRIDAIIAKIQHIETLLKDKNNNKDLILYIFDYLFKDLTEISFMINIGGDMNRRIRETTSNFQDLQMYFYERKSDEIDESYLYIALGKIKKSLMENSSEIQKLLEGKAND